MLSFYIILHATKKINVFLHENVKKPTQKSAFLAIHYLLK